MFIDTHSHLNFKAFASDYDSAILRAQKAGVEKIIIVGSNLETSTKAVEIAKNYDFVYAAVGLHPIHVGDLSTSLEAGKFDETAFLKLAKEKKVVAIGETGLDYYHGRTNISNQQAVFLKHLCLANVVGKPVILHSRDAGQDILSILMTQTPLPKGVFHCFSEDWQFAKVILDLGFYISFTGIITFSKNYANLETVKNIPLEKILIETDSPYLTPEPHRGKRNEPALVVEVAKKIAELRKIPVDVVADQTSKNALELFKI